MGLTDHRQKAKNVTDYRQQQQQQHKLYLHDYVTIYNNDNKGITCLFREYCLFAPL